jgi:hypothetical protein
MKGAAPTRNELQNPSAGGFSQPARESSSKAVFSSIELADFANSATLNCTGRIRISGVAVQDAGRDLLRPGTTTAPVGSTERSQGYGRRR